MRVLVASLVFLASTAQAKDAKRKISSAPAATHFCMVATSPAEGGELLYYVALDGHMIGKFAWNKAVSQETVDKMLAAGECVKYPARPCSIETFKDADGTLYSVVEDGAPIGHVSLNPVGAEDVFQHLVAEGECLPH